METEKKLKKILLAPHNDDEALFASFICMREKPTVIIVTDSWRQFKRGERDITAEVRREESRKAMQLLGCPVEFIGISDNKLVWENLCTALKQFDADVVYAPAIQGGNVHHDLIGCAALKYFKNVIQYTTYSKDALYTEGETEIIPTAEERALKEQALLCYKSQIVYYKTSKHFEAVQGKNEWIITHIRLRHLFVLYYEMKNLLWRVKRKIKTLCKR
jgi:LmbE family N-acetylglucosaminyl deacetylase